MEYYSTMKRNAFESVLMRWMNREPVIQCEVGQKEKDKYHILTHIWKTQQWPQDWKRSVFIPIPKKGNAKECSNYHTNALTR